MLYSFKGMLKIKIFVIFAVCLLSACGGSGSGAIFAGIPCTLGKGAPITVSGQATYDRVALTPTAGLNFNDISKLPIRGAVAQVICNGVIASTTTDASGNYSLSVPEGTENVFIRIKAQLLKTGTPSWGVTVSDANQVSQALVFSIDGRAFIAGSIDIVRNLHASSGWYNNSYKGARSAAPFAILDTIYESMQLVLNENSNLQFPVLNVKWSTSNTNGTYYNKFTKTITVLGHISDTDEFDEHVIAHEWAHYFQDVFSRDESIGGPHSINSILDIRVAFSEGFGNALSAIITGDPVYKDSSGVLFPTGLTVNIESNSCANKGWFNECSIQSVLYDLYDGTNDDVYDFGFTPMYDILTVDILQSDALTSLFSFMRPYREISTSHATAADTLLTAQSIALISDDEGTGRSNNPGTANQLPLYIDRTDTSFPSTTLCSYGEFGGYNGLGVRRFIQLKVPATGSYRFTANKVSSEPNSTDPDLYLYYKGEMIGSAEGTTTNTESLTKSLVAGSTYVLELDEFRVYGQPDYIASTADDETCFNITRTTL